MGKIIDKIMFNRLVAIITSFILGLLKIFSVKLEDKDVPTPPTDKKVLFPRIRKKLEELKND